MVDINESAVEQIVHGGETLGTGELIDLLERYHDDRPGVPKAAIDAYAQALQEREDSSLGADAFSEPVDDALTDSKDWIDNEHFYELGDGRISQYPMTWHQGLRGERDPAAYLRFFQETAPSVLNNISGGRQSANEDQLIDVMVVVGGMSPESAKAEIESARDDDRIVEDADQHPKAGVYLPENL